MSPQTEIEKKEWTIMIYFASDNALAPGIVSQLKAIKDAGYHPEANVIAHFDPHVEGAETHVFDVNLYNKVKDGGRSRAGFPTSIPYVMNLTLDKLWPDEGVREKIQKSLNLNGGGNGRDAARARVAYDPPKLPDGMSAEQSPKKSLARFINFCRDNYPARHYMLFILGHGLVVGNDLFLFDENAPRPQAAQQGAAGNGQQPPPPGRDRAGQAQGTGKEKESARQNYLMLKELGEVLRAFKNGTEASEDGTKATPGIGKDSKFELLAFHSCSMSSLEVAHELQDTADYMLASQGPAFVGSWPYRHILVRVFRNLSAALNPADLTDAAALAAALKKESDPSKLLRKEFGEVGNRLLEEYAAGEPGKELLAALLKGLNKCLRNPELCRDKAFEKLSLPEAALKLSGRAKLRRDDVTRLNRMLLAEAYPRTLSSVPQIDVREMLKKIFAYVLYNSHDFQLAGYSFDLCLSDLKKVPDTTVPLKELASTLTKGLEDEVAKSLIILAHWDAQSYWQETYTDLYDFCYRLDRRCAAVEAYTAGPTRDTLGAIREACGKAMDVLKRPPIEDDVKKTLAESEDKEEQKAAQEKLKDGLVVAAKYAGPSYQYSHGFSVYFPWSKPTDREFWDEGYREYEFNKTTGWAEFLERYFELTMRETHREEAEKDPRQVVRKKNMEEELLEEIGGRFISEAGQLGKGGGNDWTGKGGGNDWTGDCSCPSIKNHPKRMKDTKATKDAKDAKDAEDTKEMCVSPNFYVGIMKP